MADYGIAVKKALYNGAAVNKDVTGCADYELAYSSKFSVLKQQSSSADSGTNTITINNTDINNPNRVTIPHNLGYVPIFAVYGEVDPGDNKRRLLTSWSDERNSVDIYAYADTTNLYIEQCKFDGTNFGVYSFYYYIFYDEAGA